MKKSPEELLEILLQSLGPGYSGEIFYPTHEMIIKGNDKEMRIPKSKWKWGIHKLKKTTSDGEISLEEIKENLN